MNLQEIYKNRSYNITNYLRLCHEKKEKPDPMLMATVDFSQVSIKDVDITWENGHHTRDQLQQSLAENIIDNLPIEAYRDFVTAHWIQYSGGRGSSIVYKAFIHQSSGLLDLLHKKCLKECEQDKKFLHSYNKNFIEPIVSLKSNFSERSYYHQWSAEFIDFYYQLFKECSSERKDLIHALREGKEEVKFTRRRKHPWLDTALNDKNYSETLGVSFNRLINVLCAHELFAPILEDALMQGLKKFKTMEGVRNMTLGVSEKNMKNAVVKAITHHNMKALDIMTQVLGVTSEDIYDASEKRIKEGIGLLAHSSQITLPTEDKGKQDILTSAFSEFYQSLKSKYFSHKTSSYEAIFGLNENEEVSSRILKSNDIHFPSDICSYDKEEKVGAHHIMLLSICMKEFIKHVMENSKRVNIPVSYMEMHLAHAIMDNKDLISNYDKFQPHLKECWPWVEKFFTENITTKDFSSDYCKAWIQKLHITKECDGKEQTKKIRSKI